MLVEITISQFAKEFSQQRWLLVFEVQLGNVIFVCIWSRSFILSLNKRGTIREWVNSEFFYCISNLLGTFINNLTDLSTMSTQKGQSQRQLMSLIFFLSHKMVHATYVRMVYKMVYATYVSFRCGLNVVGWNVSKEIGNKWFQLCYERLHGSTILIWRDKNYVIATP